MKYAVIKTGGKQYRVSEGDLVRIEKLTGEVGEKITLAEVLFIGGNGDAENRLAVGGERLCDRRDCQPGQSEEGAGF